jgi:hypothetical protein
MQEQNADLYFNDIVIIQLKSEISKVHKEAGKREKRILLGSHISVENLLI